MFWFDENLSMKPARDENWSPPLTSLHWWEQLCSQMWTNQFIFPLGNKLIEILMTKNINLGRARLIIIYASSSRHPATSHILTHFFWYCVMLYNLQMPFSPVDNTEDLSLWIRDILWYHLLFAVRQNWVICVSERAAPTGTFVFFIISRWPLSLYWSFPRNHMAATQGAGSVGLWPLHFILQKAITSQREF